MAIYKDGPLWVEGNPGEKPRLKTFLSATKEEILEHGFTPFYKDCYEITKDGKLTYVTEEGNDFWNPMLTMFRESPDRLSDVILWYAIGKNNHTDEPTYGKREKSLEMEVGPFNPSTKGLYLIKHSFEFRQGAEDLFQSLSDVDAIIQMAESMKGLSVLSSVEIDVKKQDELYHVQIEGAPFKWSLYDHCVVDHDFQAQNHDFQAQNMEEFLPQLQKAELEYCDAELKFLKDTIASKREEWKTVTESERESPEALDRLTEFVKQTQSQKEIVEQSLNEKQEEELSQEDDEELER